MSQRRIKGRRGAVPEYGLVYRDHDGRMRRQTCTSCACDVAAFTRLCVKLGRDLPKIDLGEMIERFKIENSPESVAHFLQHHCTNHNLHLVLSDEETLGPAPFVLHFPETESIALVSYDPMKTCGAEAVQ